MGEEVRRESWGMGEGKERGRSGKQSYYRSEVVHIIMVAKAMVFLVI